MSSTISRRSSFIGGNRSLSDGSMLPRPAAAPHHHGAAGNMTSASTMNNATLATTLRAGESGRSSSKDGSNKKLATSSSARKKTKKKKMSQQEYIQRYGSLNGGFHAVPWSELPDDEDEEEELDEDEAASIAAFEALRGADAKGEVSVDELHSFLGKFGLIVSRDKLKDELHVQTPEVVSPVAAARTPMAASSSSPGRTGAAAPGGGGGAVPKDDFVEFLTNHKQQHAIMNRRVQHQQQATNRIIPAGEEAWISQAIERQQHAQQQQHRGRGMSMAGSSGSGLAMLHSSTMNNNNKSETVVSILDPQQVSTVAGDSLVHQDSFSGGSTVYGNDMQDSLAAIEVKLRKALEDRANTPVPAVLKLDHNNNNSLSSGGGGGAKSPGRSSTPGSPSRAGRRQGTGVMNSMYVPSGQAFQPKISKPAASASAAAATSHHSPSAVGSSGGNDASSPSAVLRRHQQQQLEALLAIRKSGGNILQQRSAQRRAPNQMAGFTVVRGSSSSPSGGKK